jgi:PAS domain S-box-containing protein
MLEKSAIIISQPPPGYLEISSGLGGAAPNAIIVLPIKHLGKVSGVVEFASFRAFSDSEQTLLDELVPIIATNLEILDRTQRTERLLIETREQAQRMEKQAALLEEQQVEMEAQQSELKATEAWFRGIIEAAPDGMLVVDDSGKIVLTNPRLEELFGYEPGELIGSPIEKLVPDVARSIHVGLRDEFLNSREPSRHEMGALGRELRGRKIDGTEFPLEVGLARLPSLHGRGTCVCAAVRDITQRKEAERLILLAKEAAEAATSAKSNFLAMMSHEIRTPMNGVMAMAEMLDQTDLSPDQRSMSSVIRGSADSLMTILNDILDFSKIEAGKLELESIPFDLGDTIEEAAELVASRADEKNLELIVSIDPNLPATIFGDPTRIRQILLNFLSNAIKFTESGSVQLAVAAGDISIDRQSGEFIVEVSDTGIGMNETQVAKMFQAFSQADTSTSRRFGGTGLGLSICQRLAEMMGGTVGVKSSVGAGSTFWFKLPARISDPQPAHPVVDISDAKVLAMGFSIRNRKALEGILRTARITDIVWEADPTSTLGELEKIDSKAIPIVFLAGDPTRAIQASRQITRGRSNVRAVVAAPRALASTLIAAPEAGAFDAVTMPLRRRRVWLSIAAALDRASLAASGNDAQSALERFYPPEKDEALAAKAVVLVAEDNMTNQHVIKRVLDRAGYFSIFADDGQFALEAFVKEPGIGLLLTDYHMPRMDGLELTRAIREKEKTDGGRLPIIMLTADALPETGHAVAEAGGDGYLTKPVKYALVRDALEQWLPAGASLRQLSPQKRDDKGTTEAKISKAASAETEPTIIDPASVEPIVDLSVLTDLIGEADVAQISEALELFWESVQSGPDEIASALVSKNYKALREVAHSLKGAAASVGAKAVAADLAILEMAAKEENLERAQSIIDPIRSGFMAIQTFVNAYTGRA